MTLLLPTATTRETWRELRVLGRGRGALALASLATLVAGTAAGLLVPPLLGRMVDLVVDGEGPSAMTVPALLLFGVAIVRAALTALGDVLVARLGETLLADLRESVVDRALQLPLERIERGGSGDLISRVSGDGAIVATAVRTALPALARAGLTIALTIAGLAVLDWRFAVAGLLAAPLELYTLRWYLRRSTPVYAAERVADGVRSQQLLDSIGGAETVRAFALSEAHVGAVRDRSATAVERALAANHLSTRFYGRLNLAELIGLAAVLCTGYWLVGSGEVTVGAAAAAALYFHGLFDPINTLLGLFDTAQEATAGLARLVGVASAEPEAEPVSPQTPSRDEGVRIAGVDFGYVPGRPVLHGIDLDLAAGEHVALVGASGAGKTTLAKLLAGVHVAGAGEIAFGDVRLRDVRPGELRDHVALVTQEVHVFTGTLADDLRLADPAATDEQLRDALHRVGAEPWLATLEQGLATVVGDGAHRLTAMQAQQVALARVILTDPAVLVLDEATADAGSAGARLLDAAAEEALRGRTALVVAHRLSQAARADRVVVLADGRVAESGPPAALVAAGGEYARLWAAWTEARE